MLIEGIDYKWANWFDRNIARWLPFWYFRKAILLRNYVFSISSISFCQENYMTDELKECSCVFFVPKGTSWNGPSIGVAYSNLMKATLEHDIPYRWHGMKKYKNLKREDVERHFIENLRNSGVSENYIKAIQSKPIQKLFKWAWKNNLG